MKLPFMKRKSKEQPSSRYSDIFWRSKDIEYRVLAPHQLAEVIYNGSICGVVKTYEHMLPSWTVGYTQVIDSKGHFRFSHCCEWVSKTREPVMRAVIDGTQVPLPLGIGEPSE